MKSLDEQDHYELLEVPRNAGMEEIERAYRIVSSTYAEASLATYSIFDPNDSAAISHRVEFAYRVLSDEVSRSQYDHSLGLDPDSMEMPIEEPRRPGVGAVFDPVSPAFENFEDAAAEREGGFDGPRLRRARMRRGIDIGQIADITKINVRYLRCIEEELFADLPAEVYVRGFVTAYARAIGLDPVRVVPDFMGRFVNSFGGKRGGFLLGGK